jgi:hypothetical protein
MGMKLGLSFQWGVIEDASEQSVEEYIWTHHETSQ